MRTELQGTPSLDLVREKFGSLHRWFLETALPFWWESGADHVNGGWFEKMDDSCRPLEEPRRARLVARQIFVFSVAPEVGWTGPWRQAVGHGLDFLNRHLLREDGTVVSSVRPDGVVVNPGFDNYDYAFVLFCLAAAARALPERQEDLSATAAKICQRMVTGWSHPLAGFQETMPPSAPLKANPHMHLLEAFLAWANLNPADGRWAELADKIVGLCRTRFMHPVSGAVREYFDLNWQPLPDDRMTIIEPGHQFEWAWLLLRWSALHGGDDAAADAIRLVDIGERYGVDPVRGVAINELDGSLRPRERDARLWPQTERIKAWYFMARRAIRPIEREAALQRLASAITGLLLFLAERPAGIWWETIREDGRYAPEPARASSLYHIACAIQTVNNGLDTLS